MSISAGEVNRQADKLEEQVVAIQRLEENVYSNLEDLATIVKSEDSDLYNDILNLGKAFTRLECKERGAFGSLIETMREYAKATIANEDRHSSEVIETSASLDELLNDIESY